LDGQDPAVVEARYVRGYTVWLRFDDGVEGELDLEPSLNGEVLEPLREPTVFRTFFVHPEFATIAWPNGADLAPDVLYERIRSGRHTNHGSPPDYNQS
jgi:hypothetical protein